MKTNTKGKIKRSICFALTAILLSQGSAQTVLAWPGETPVTGAEATESIVTDPAVEDTEAGESGSTEESATEPEILQEIEENRGEFSKEYLLSDNSHAVVVYPEQIHYENEENY